jgi:methionyl-tRNA formyltransferase
MEELRIVFMGTEFAVGILDCIIKTTILLLGSLLPRINLRDADKNSTVKEYALAHNLRLLQPTNLKEVF